MNPINGSAKMSNTNCSNSYSTFTCKLQGEDKADYIPELIETIKMSE